MTVDLAATLPSGEIRRAREKDIDRVLEIEHLAFGRQWDYYQFKASLEDIFLVYVDQEITGFIIACCCSVSARGLIVRLAVHPEQRGRGIATALVRAALEELKKKNLKDVELDVDVVKHGARRLYEKMGFKVVELISLSEDEDDSFYVMRRPLNC